MSPGSWTRSSAGTSQKLGLRGEKVDQADLVKSWLSYFLRLVFWQARLSLSH